MTKAQQLGITEFPYREYDANGNQTYFEYSDGYWFKCEYDAQGNETYFENSNGVWWKSEYDDNGNVTYYENSDGFWCKREYDANGNRTYTENSKGFIKDKRPFFTKFAAWLKRSLKRSKAAKQ